MISINLEQLLVSHFFISDDLYTYGIMAAAGIAYLVARRGGYSAMTCGAAFVSAPIFALFQKREVDFYENTTNAM